MSSQVKVLFASKLPCFWHNRSNWRCYYNLFTCVTTDQRYIQLLLIAKLQFLWNLLLFGRYDNIVTSTNIILYYYQDRTSCLVQSETTSATCKYPNRHKVLISAGFVPNWNVVIVHYLKLFRVIQHTVRVVKVGGSKGHIMCTLDFEGRICARRDPSAVLHIREAIFVL